MMCMWQRWRSNAAMARKNPVVWKCEASFVAGDLKPKRQKRVIVDDDLDAAISRLFPVLGLLELVADCLMTFLRRLESTNFGPVQDVSIPYQQKRMFGFVTFDFPETVKLILAKGNPHFVCDARVLVKPYKEKGKIPDKHRLLNFFLFKDSEFLILLLRPCLDITNRKQQQMERGDFTGCGSPTGLESSDPFDLGARMFYNTRDMLWNRKLEEQADLQQSIELQNRRLMGLQFLDVKRNSHHHRTLSTGVVVSPPATFFPTSFDGQNVVVVVVPSNPSSPVAKEAKNVFDAAAKFLEEMDHI